MAKAGSLWQRVGGIFRTNHPPAELWSDTTTRTLAGRTPESLNGRPRALAPAAEPARVSWWQRRQARQMQVRQASQRVVQLADELERYFRRQDERAAELTGSLGHVGGVLEQLAETQRTHSECLRGIAQHTEAGVKHSAMLTETLGRLPDSLVTQAEAIRAVARQLQVGQESDTQLTQSLQQFGRAVDTLGSAGTSQVEMLQRLNAAQREQHEALVTLVREQSRRFMLILVVGAILAVAALAALALPFALQWLR
jgi:hypothetical protein